MVALFFFIVWNLEGILVGLFLIVWQLGGNIGSSLFFFLRSIQSREQVVWAEQADFNSASYEYKETGKSKIARNIQQKLYCYLSTTQ